MLQSFLHLLHCRVQFEYKHKTLVQQCNKYFGCDGASSGRWAEIVHSCWALPRHLLCRLIDRFRRRRVLRPSAELIMIRSLPARLTADVKQMLCNKRYGQDDLSWRHWICYLLLTVLVELASISNESIRRINVLLLIVSAIGRVTYGPVLYSKIVFVSLFFVYVSLLLLFEFQVVLDLKITFIENFALMLLHFAYMYTYLLRTQASQANSKQFRILGRVILVCAAAYLINLSLTSICYPKYFGNFILLPSDCSFVTFQLWQVIITITVFLNFISNLNIFFSLLFTGRFAHIVAQFYFFKWLFHKFWTNRSNFSILTFWKQCSDWYTMDNRRKTNWLLFYCANLIFKW